MKSSQIEKNTGLIVRLDDVTDHMNWTLMDKCQNLFNKYNIKPLLGVIPNNEVNTSWFVLLEVYNLIPNERKVSATISFEIPLSILLSAFVISVIALVYVHIVSKC